MNQNKCDICQQKINKINLKNHIFILKNKNENTLYNQSV
jgi:hypothetical protein